MTAPGYRSTAGDAGGYPDNELLSARIEPPREPVHARICLRNTGPRRIELYAAYDNAKTLSATTVDGRHVDPTPALDFVEAEQHSVASRAAEIVDELTTFRPWFVEPWLLWPLLLLVVVGVPAGVLWALWRSLGDDA